MLTQSSKRVKLWYKAQLCNFVSVCLSVCKLVCLAVCQTLGVYHPQWELCLWSEWRGRMERHWRRQKRHYEAWFSYPWNVVTHATLSVSPSWHWGQNEHTDWRGAFRRGRQGFIGPFFHAVPAAGWGGLRCVVSLEKVIRHGLLRSGDIHHIVCEKHCFMPSFFLSVLSN